jgi:hypothetical protein
MKLGELLLRENIITPAQLSEALTIQNAYGIRLGSCLVKMGYVQEGKLLQFLSDKLHAPIASFEELSAADNDVINAISRELIVKYRVFPFRLEGKRLSIAMNDPSDLRAIDEIGFITGYVVKPHLASELAIAKLLARHFKYFTIDARYNDVHERVKPQNDSKQEKVLFPIRSESGEFVTVEVPADFGGFGYEDAILDRQKAPEAIVKGTAQADGGKSSKEPFFELQNKFEALLSLLQRKGLVSEQELSEELWLRKIQSLPEE